MAPGKLCLLGLLDPVLNSNNDRDELVRLEKQNGVFSWSIFTRSFSCDFTGDKFSMWTDCITSWRSQTAKHSSSSSSCWNEFVSVYVSYLPDQRCYVQALVVQRVGNVIRMINQNQVKLSTGN
ncbi:uncharacterized protein LOC110043973 [Orbicella faveolata]|uniref:uncharacterized protein LOC110043973 n=1 Tax=Orbicella faveolata TaxID=48498 RepID=UPI0009E24972|nr:uncharacterized protein LOC110043973 [Orbicella faveolata]